MWHTAKNGVLCPATGLGLPHTDKNTPGLLHSAISIMRHGARKFMQPRRKFDFPFLHLQSAAGAPIHLLCRLDRSHSFSANTAHHACPAFGRVEAQSMFFSLALMWKCGFCGAHEIRTSMFLQYQPMEWILGFLVPYIYIDVPLLRLLLRKEGIWVGRGGGGVFRGI